MKPNGKNSTSLERLIFVIFLVWGILALFLAMFDLQISIMLFDRDAGWSKIVADYGEVPGNVVIIIALLGFSASKKEINPVIQILIIGGIFGGLLWQTHALVDTFIDGSGSQILLITVILVMFSLVVIRKGNIAIPDGIQSFSVMTLLLAIINPLFFVQVVKTLWGRVRFRDLAPSFTDYSPWYLPQGPTGHRSFPSGHAAMGWMLLPILLLPRLQKKKAVYYLSIGIVVVWGGIVALGRVVAGAHYASDVLFSTGMAWVVFLVLDNYLQKKRNIAHAEEKNNIKETII